MSNSKYAQAWAILKESKALTLTLHSPRVERTVRKALAEHKKLDKEKNYLERIKVVKSVTPEGKIRLDFSLITTLRKGNDFLDLLDAAPKDKSNDKPDRFDIDLPIPD